MKSMSDYQAKIDAALRLAEMSASLLKTPVDPKVAKIVQRLVIRDDTLQKVLLDFSRRAAKAGVDDFTAPVADAMRKVALFLEQRPEKIAKNWAEAGGELAGVEQWATRAEPGLVFIESVPGEIVDIGEQLRQMKELAAATDDDTRLIAAELRWGPLQKGLGADGPTLLANMDSLKSGIAALKAELDLGIAHSRKKLAAAARDELLADLGVSGPPPEGKEEAATRARLEAWAEDFAGYIASDPSKKTIKREMARAVKRIKWLEEQASGGAMQLNVQQASWRSDGDWEPLLKSIGSSGVCLALTLDWLGGGGNPDSLEDGELSQKVQVSQQAGRIQRALENSRHPSILEARRKELEKETVEALKAVRDAVEEAEDPLGSPKPELSDLEEAANELEEQEEDLTNQIEALEDEIEDEKDALFALEGERDDLEEELQELLGEDPKDDEAIRLKTEARDDKGGEVTEKEDDIRDAERRLGELRAARARLDPEAAQARVAMWKALDDVESFLEPIAEAIAVADAAATRKIDAAVQAHQTGTVTSLEEAKGFETEATGKLVEIEGGLRKLIALAAQLKKEPVPEEAESGPRDELPPPFLKAMGVKVAKRPTLDETTTFTQDTAVEEISRRCRQAITGVEEDTAASWHISLKGASGHALGLRLRADGGVEFLDANAGGYSFSDVNAFESWVPGWWDAFGLKSMSSIALSRVE